MSLLLILLLALVPLTILPGPSFHPGLSFHYDTVPRVAMLGIGSAALLLARPRRMASKWRGLWTLPAGRLLTILAATHVAWLTVVCLASTRPWFSWLGNAWRRMGWVTLLALAVIAICSAAILAGRRDLIRNALRATMFSTAIASIYGICQYFDIDPLQDPVGYHARAGDFVIVRPPGTMGHADYFGWWLAVALFCVLALVRIEVGRWRLAGRVTAALCASAIIFTGTRAAMIASIVGFACMIAAAGVRQFRRPFLIAASSLALLAGFYFSPPGERLRARVHWVFEEPLGGARPLLWRDSLRMAAAHPLNGTGPETFAAAFPLWQSTDLSRLAPDFYHESPHNALLDALTEQGIPGGLLLLCWVALGFCAGRRACCAGEVLAPALIGALAASVVAGAFGVGTAGPVFQTLFVISLLVALTTEKAPPAHEAPLLLVSAMVPAALLLGAFAVALSVSDYALARAAATPTAELARSPELLPLRLPGAAGDLFWSRRLPAACAVAATAVSRAECMRLAIQSASLATGSSDNPALAWYNLAIFSSTLGDAAGVEKSLRAAAAVSPNWFKPHWTLAKLLLLSNQFPQARAEAERAVRLDGGKDAEVSETLREAEARR